MTDSFIVFDFNFVIKNVVIKNNIYYIKIYICMRLI